MRFIWPSLVSIVPRFPRSAASALFEIIQIERIDEIAEDFEPLIFGIMRFDRVACDRGIVVTVDILVHVDASAVHDEVIDHDWTTSTDGECDGVAWAGVDL